MSDDPIRQLFAPTPGTIYLDTATYGLLPRPTVAAMTTALHAWETGEADFAADWETAGDEARALFARLIGAGADEIGLVPTVSVGVGPVVASLGPGDEMLIPAGEFTSVMYPFLVMATRRGFTVREAPFAHLAGAVTPRTTLVACSLVRSQDGATVDLGALCDAAETHGARVLIDTTHALPFYPIRQYLPRIHAMVCHGYKHLLLPRGAGFFYARRDMQAVFPPVHANWRAVDDTDTHSYGGPLPVTEPGRRFDVSLDWLSWVGARESLRLLNDWQDTGALAAAKARAGRLAAAFGEPAPGASVVSVPVADAEAVLATLRAAGIKAGAPAGRIRLAPHVYNTDAELDRVIEVLSPFVVAAPVA